MTPRALDGRDPAEDMHLARDGRVMEILSEHTCEGWLEGYLLTGRHGLFSCYEAFIHIVDSMFNQHAKWLEVTPRDSVAPADRVAELSAVVPRLAPGAQWLHPSGSRLHRHVAQQEGAHVVRVYLPPDANTLLCGDRHVPRSRNRINVIVAGNSRELQWLDMDAAIEALHRQASAYGSGRATTTAEMPDVVMACAGDVPTLETLAAVQIAAQARSRTQDPRGQCRGPDDAAAARGASPHGLTGASSTPCSPRKSR